MIASPSPKPEAVARVTGRPPLSRESQAASSITTCRIAPAPIPKQSAAQ